jgi:hypothetical protein
MASYESVNYSLRPSKSIERQIIFDGVRELQTALELPRAAYIGFGSIWFTDFVMAHRLLRAVDMLSIEREDIGYHRACFNSPYSTVQIEHGTSNEVLPEICNRDSWTKCPWVVWLDYDGICDEMVTRDLEVLVERSPANSIVIATFNAHDGSYGLPDERRELLRSLLGEVVPDDMSKKSFKGGRFQKTIADLGIAYMKGLAGNASRPGGFLPAFRVPYKDGAPMVTIGGILPSRENRAKAEELVARSDWLCMPEKPIIAPHLTMREAAVLQAQLPCDEPLSRDLVRSLGFDLEDHQIETFQTYYRQYPTFAQIMS